MRIFNSMEAAIEGGDSRSYVASKGGFLKVVEVGGPAKPIHAVFASPSATPDLEAIKPQIVLKNVTPIPALIIAKAAAIFRHVYEKYNGAEMITLLRWREEDFGDGRKIGRYYLDRAERVEIAAGGLDYHQHVPIVGTIHSHGAGSAFFSSTDDRWEKEDTPGIYITIGNVNAPVPSIEASIAGHGNRIKMDVPDIPKEVFDSIVLSDEEKAWWTETLTVKQYSRTEGYYIVVGNTITGWSPTETPALHEGEKVYSVKEFKPKEKAAKIYRLKPTKKNYKTKREGETPTGGIPSLGEFLRMSKFINFLREKDYLDEFLTLFMNGAEEDEIGLIDGMIRSHTYDGSVAAPTIDENIWLGKCVHFILKHGFVEEFFDLFLSRADDEDIDTVSNLLDLKLGETEEETEDECESSLPGKSHSLDAEELGTTFQRPWDDFWRD